MTNQELLKDFSRSEYVQAVLAALKSHSDSLVAELIAIVTAQEGAKELLLCKKAQIEGAARVLAAFTQQLKQEKQYDGPDSRKTVR